MANFYLPEIIFFIATLALLVSTMQAMRNWKLYSFMFVFLAFYGATCMSATSKLATEFSYEAIIHSSLVFLVGTLTLLISIGVIELMLPHKKNAALIWKQKIQSVSSIHTKIALILILISLSILLISRNDLSQNWSEARSSSGILDVIATFLFLLACPGIASGLYKKKLSITLCLVIGCIIVFIFIGSRAAILGAFAYGVWASLVRARSRLQQFRFIVIFAFLGLLAHISLRYIRGIGIVNLFQAVTSGQLLQLFFSSDVSQDISGGEAAISKYLVFATNYESLSDYGFMTSVRRVMFFFVPRLDWFPIKPQDVTYTLWSDGFLAGLFNGSDGYEILQESLITGNLGSLHPTLFGELFLSGSWISLVYSLVIYAFLAVFIDRSILLMSPLNSLFICGPVLVGFMMVARGNSVIGFGYFLYLATIVLVSTFIIRQSSKSIKNFFTACSQKAKL